MEDHFIHFFFLAAPDFVLGPDADPADRNIVGVIKKVGVDLGGKVIDIRKRCREIIKLNASTPAHPVGGGPAATGIVRWMKTYNGPANGQKGEEA